MTVTLVIGAAASGKSAYAESLCLGHDGPRVYLATMEPFGEEGARRIARHRALREGKGFSTLERTRDVGAAVPGLIWRHLRALSRRRCWAVARLSPVSSSVGRMVLVAGWWQVMN